MPLDLTRPHTVRSWLLACSLVCALTAPHVAIALHQPATATPPAEPASLPASQPGSQPGPQPGTDAAEAPSDPRINPETGRKVANWPKARHFDHLHMRLDLIFPDLSKPELTGVMTLRAKAQGRTRATMVLDSRGPKIESVTVGGIQATFEVADGKLRIELPRPVPMDEEVTVVLRYSLDYAANRGEGLTFSSGKPDGKGPTEQSTQIHAQGQAELNSRWFPCHDFPNERLATELVVTLPASTDEHPWEVVSNGRLESKVQNPDGTTTWHWNQALPHPPYLVTLGIAKFAVIDIGGPTSARPGLPMPIYVPIGTEEKAVVVFEDTARMVAFFEKLFDEPYPWDMYAQVCVRDFAAGGMENTSATFLMVSAATSAPGSQDDLIAHELAHQWFGNLITCKSWEHLWLNEGWATFAEALWAEEEARQNHPDDPAMARNAYMRSIAQDAQGLRRNNRATAPRFTAMVSNRYSDPERVFSKMDNPYSKGALVIHMLRQRLGDNAFFTGVRLYVDRHKFGTVETDDFRRVLEEVSGQSLEHFFESYTLRPGLPKLAIDLAWESGSSTLTIAAEQTQTIDRFNPAYALSLPIVVELEGGGQARTVLEFSERTGRVTLALPARPTDVRIDPDITCLAAVTKRTPLPRAKKPEPEGGGEPASP